MPIDDDESDLTPLTDTDFSDSDDSDFEASAPPAKRRRVSRPKPREKAKKKEVVKIAPKKLRAYKGVLQEMWALPLDVTYEVRVGHTTVQGDLLTRIYPDLRSTETPRPITAIEDEQKAEVVASGPIFQISMDTGSSQRGGTTGMSLRHERACIC
jgi:hypothetical protein